jgi:alpha-L-fucosidase 2
MQYLARVKAKVRGGNISTNQNSIVIKDATELIIYVSAATDFRSFAFKEKTSAYLAAAFKKSYDVEKGPH